MCLVGRSNYFISYMLSLPKLRLAKLRMCVCLVVLSTLSQAELVCVFGTPSEVDQARDLK